MAKRTEALEVYFYKTSSGNEPVREWLKALSKEDKRTIGFDIKTVQYGYPIGMPLTRVLHGTGGLEEVRCNISNGIARVIFYVEDNTMVLLHAFIKKTQETPKKELDVAITTFSIVFKVIEVLLGSRMRQIAVLEVSSSFAKRFTEILSSSIFCSNAYAITLFIATASDS